MVYYCSFVSTCLPTKTKTFNYLSHVKTWVFENKGIFQRKAPLKL